MTEEIEIEDDHPAINHQLTNYVSAVGPFGYSTATRRALKESAKRGIMGLSQSINPMRQLQQVQPTQSRSSAEMIAYGQDLNTWDLLDEMVDKDATIRACVELVVSAITKLEYGLAFDANKPEEKLLGESIQRDILDRDGRFGFKSLIYALAYGRAVHGVSIAEAVWEFTPNGTWAPCKFFHRHPGLFEFDEYGDCYLLTGEEAGNMVSPEKFLVCSSPSIYASPWTISPLFPLRYAYFIKKSMFIARTEFAETHGQPLLVVKVPAPNNTGTAESARRVAALKSALANLRAETAILIQGNETIEAINRTAQATTESFDVIIREIDELIVRSLLGSTLGVLESQYGTRAQAEVHERTSQERMTDGASEVASAINQLIKAYVKINFGEEMVKFAPKLSFDLDQERDVTESIQILDLANRIGIKIDEDQAREWLGLEKPKEVDQEESEVDFTALRNLMAAAPAAIIQGGVFTINEVRLALGLEQTPEGEKPLKLEIPGAPTDQSQFQTGRFSDQKPKKRFENLEAIGEDLTDRLVVIGEELSQINKQHVTSAVRKLIDNSKDVQSVNDVDLEPIREIPITEDATVALEAAAALSYWGASQQVSRGVLTFAGFDEKSELNEVWDAYHQAVNMTASELESWAEDPCSKEASISRAPIERNLRLLKTAKENWTARDIEDAKRTISFIARMRGAPTGEPAKNGCPSKKTISLRNWAFNPDASKTFTGEPSPLLAFATPAEIEAVMPSIPDAFKNGVRWMLDRKIMSVAEVKSLAKSIQELGGSDLASISRQIRQDVLALAKSTSDQMTQKVQNLISSAVDQGTTINDFLEAMDDGLAKGQVPGGLDSYLTNVYRTETSNAYARQREENLNNPLVRDIIWGIEIYNPDDARSRDSHAAMSGVRIKRGSEADALRGVGPPWSYQCRCSAIPLIAVPGSSEYSETENAVTLVKRIERF